MKKITKRKALILISTGLFIITITPIASRLMEFPDFVKGAPIGIGIGLLLTSLIFGNFKTEKE
ncbi:hypothetical protein Q4603_20705 [Zobellia galactanivorans]|uniref:hypothetical protein n=1 Tax=Zobellia TaxID=112040 RepID=UPI000F4E4748|nr:MULTISPECIES: hypothetical protein [Zobellia]MDO6811054.1 hypothetical protein [Zobellia galactanivorans]